MDDTCEFNQSGPEGQCEQTAHWLIESFKAPSDDHTPDSRVQSCDEHLSEFMINEWESGATRFNVEHF